MYFAVFLTIDGVFGGGLDNIVGNVLYVILIPIFTALVLGVTVLLSPHITKILFEIQRFPLLHNQLGVRGIPHSDHFINNHSDSLIHKIIYVVIPMIFITWMLSVEMTAGVIDLLLEGGTDGMNERYPDDQYAAFLSGELQFL